MLSTFCIDVPYSSRTFHPQKLFLIQTPYHPLILSPSHPSPFHPLIRSPSHPTLWSSHTHHITLSPLLSQPLILTTSPSQSHPLTPCHISLSARTLSPLTISPSHPLTPPSQPLTFTTSSPQAHYITRSPLTISPFHSSPYRPFTPHHISLSPFSFYIICSMSTFPVGAL